MLEGGGGGLGWWWGGCLDSGISKENEGENVLHIKGKMTQKKGKQILLKNTKKENCFLLERNQRMKLTSGRG